MKSLIVCTSVSHGNTRKVAEVIGEVLGASVVAPEEADLTGHDLTDYDLVGFGSGIFSRRLHPRLRDFVSALPPQRGRAFVFATCGIHAPFGPMTRLLEGKGYDVADTFSCRGHDTWAPFRLIGGIRRGRPDGRDLAAARAFAERLKRG
ncbi:flavodoxin family protein [Streptomyces sp. HD]|uniref:flavodoxin family protein n=1 Tax=Streptomyces sp. HD TaxID=3020892 RepID=UPI00232EF1F5|nr:flavodoxin family protein [Streptomyces sp. HD]MDC0773200.1 flavodoxin family protein [Streptomyces sp. HD]